MSQTNGNHPPSYLLGEYSVLVMQGEEFLVEVYEGAVLVAYRVGMPLQNRIEMNFREITYTRVTKSVKDF